MLSVIVIFVSAISTPINGFLWGCSYSPCGPGDPHTMCEYPFGVNRFAAWCMGHGSGVEEMTDEMRMCILDAHNHFRRKVAIGDTDPPQPPAANMMKLKYSREAERVVQHWINACQGGHDSCRHLQNGTPCGQNLWYTSDGLRGNMTETHQSVCYGQVEAYYSEIQFLPGRTKEDVEAFKNVHEAGHYTAMIWADVSAVGCGWMAAAIDYSNPDYTAHPVKGGCNYVGTPNLIGGLNYIVGDNCTQCPDGATCSVRYPGLCTFETEDEEYSDELSGSPPLRVCSVLVAFAVLFAIQIFTETFTL